MAPFEGPAAVAAARAMTDELTDTLREIVARLESQGIPWVQRLDLREMWDRTVSA